MPDFTWELGCAVICISTRLLPLYNGLCQTLLALLNPRSPFLSMARDISTWTGLMVVTPLPYFSYRLTVSQVGKLDVSLCSTLILSPHPVHPQVFLKLWLLGRCLFTPSESRLAHASIPPYLVELPKSACPNQREREKER